MSAVFTLHGAEAFSSDVEEWLSGNTGELLAIARTWFGCMRRCGEDVKELMHDGAPVACVGDVPFAYVNVFSSHVNVGFYMGASLSDPDALLRGTGKRMRHVRIEGDQAPPREALQTLITQAYLLARETSVLLR